MGWSGFAHGAAVARPFGYGVDDAVFETLKESEGAGKGERDFRLVVDRRPGSHYQPI